MNNKFSIAQAFVEAEVRDYNDIDLSNVWNTSKEFNTSMGKLIDKEKRVLWKYVNTTGKKIAVVLIAVIMLSGCAMSIEAIRTPVLDFVAEIYETFTRIFYDDSTHNAQTKTIEHKYSPSYMVNGFALSEDTYNLITYQQRWRNELGQEIVYQQSLLGNYNAIIDTEQSHMENVNIGSFNAIYFKSNDKQTIIWNNGTYTFKIICPLSISIDEQMNIANSIID